MIMKAMKAKKVYEMIDPYASEEDAIDLDVSYQKKLIEKWFAKWAPDAEYNIDKYLNIEIANFVKITNHSKSIKLSLPDNMTFLKSLLIYDYGFDKLPNNLTVYGTLDIYSTAINIPRHEIKKMTKAITLITRKVNEMIDPYASEENTLDLDLSYKKKQLEKWFDKYFPDCETEVDNELNVNMSGIVVSSDVSKEIIEFPSDITKLTMEGMFNLSNTKIQSLPNDLVVLGTMSLLGSDIKKLPDFLTVTYHLNIAGTDISELPPNMSVKDLYLHDTKYITELPENLTTFRLLNVRNSAVKYLPANLTCENLYLNESNIIELPKNLTVTKILDIRDTYITSLPEDLTAEQIYVSDNNIGYRTGRFETYNIRIR